MIIVRITDGLGNQMFQYALGRKLSELYGTDLKLDINWYEGDKEPQKKRKYSLNCFNIEENIVTQLDLDFFRKKNLVHFLNSRTRQLFNLPPYKIIIDQKGFEFDPTIFNCPRNTYLKGYWQTDKYFRDIRNILLKDFTLKTEINPDCQQFIKQITNISSVSVHIRRGDYVKEPYLTRIHGVCSLDYYAQSINYIKQHIQEPHFFIFSDDPEWVKENLLLEDKTTFICGYNFADYEDLYLMSLCKHNIVANSSFSWWGAWLNRNKEKIVCSPKNWFAVNSRNTEDVVPSDWLRF